MGIITLVLAFLSIISVALGVVDILQLTAEPILNAKITWEFWMLLASFLMLSTIACLLVSNKRNTLE